MRWMCELHPKLGFDCASDREIAEVINHGRPVIYAQPCKKLEDIHTAERRGVSQTVVDSVEEVEKLAEARWSGSVLVRLLVDDAGSKQPFSRKFGAPLEWLPAIYDAARSKRLNMTGFSFHVGSECGAPAQYAGAIAACDTGAEIAKRYGFSTTCVDIGGGFVPDEKSFSEVAANVTAGRRAASSLLRDPAVQWIAEPGRFLAAPTHTLYTTIIGKKPVWPAPKSAKQPAWRLTIDESVYGAFSNIPFDGQRPVLESVGTEGEVQPTVVFGRTCDSGDCIGTDIPLSVDLKVGDMLRIRNMGAYTTVTASEFNGFPKARCVYEPHLR